MKEKIKGWLAGLAYRVIVLFTLGQISPLLGAGAIIEQDGEILLIDRSDGLGYTIPGGIVRHKETVEKCSGLPFEAAFKIENEAQRFIRKTEDAREGPRAFIEKRKPNYKGR